jgi:hypothetical protein
VAWLKETPSRPTGRCHLLPAITALSYDLLFKGNKPAFPDNIAWAAGKVLVIIKLFHKSTKEMRGTAFPERANF